ncbi:MAG: DUF6261 family protein [Puniceicoccales bacterium]|jgi:hypothetical protein|nr:DUF6261 family protein [Puniceicoccales bacterium]
MRNNIRAIGLNRLRNEEHFGFHSEFVKLVGEYEINATFQGMVSVYSDHYGVLDAAMEITRRSDFTSDLETADHRRVQTFRSFRLSVNGFLYHFDPAKQAAGRKLNNTIRQYGRFDRMPRDERTYAMTNLLQDIRDKRAAEIQLLGLATWVSELETNNLAYKNLKESRYEERVERPEQKVKAARNVLDADYRKMIHFLDAMYAMMEVEDANLNTLVAALNERIGSYTHLLAQRRGIALAKKAEGSSSSSSSSSLGVALA